jgi:hypothetical protein
MFDRFRRQFPCPYCAKPVIVQEKGHGSYIFKHKVPDCETSLKPSKRHAGDLLSAFVSFCKPKMVYPPVEGLEDAAAREAAGRPTIFR